MQAIHPYNYVCIKLLLSIHISKFDFIEQMVNIFPCLCITCMLSTKLPLQELHNVLNIMKLDTIGFNMFRPQGLLSRGSSSIPYSFTMSIAKIIPLHTCSKRQFFTLGQWWITCNIKERPSTFELWGTSIWEHNVLYKEWVALVFEVLLV